MATTESIPADLFLAGYPPEISEVAERLRGVVHVAVPGRSSAFEPAGG